MYLLTKNYRMWKRLYMGGVVVEGMAVRWIGSSYLVGQAQRL